MYYTIYEQASGRIVTAFKSDEPLATLDGIVMPGQDCIFEEGSQDGHYVVDGQIVPRPLLCPDSMPLAADGASEISFVVPEGTAIHFDGQIVVIDDGVFRFRTALAKVYKFLVNPPFPYQVRQVEIVAHAV